MFFFPLCNLLNNRINLLNLCIPLNNFLKSCVCKTTYRQLYLVRTSILDIKGNTGKYKCFSFHTGQCLRLSNIVIWVSHVVTTTKTLIRHIPFVIYPTGIIRLQLLSVWFCKQWHSTAALLDL